ncbi:peptide-methionine (R)-S-oxide reductase, partial [Candidatus Bathyarchaeota archaeon]|nr:peptide-methionine (R)-S-oxide reductase [Candidatus Bathyarchaeota archaeon]
MNATRESGGTTDWKEKLSKKQFKVLRQKGTEPPFTGKYWDHHENGVYHCAGCGAPLFKSDDKF